MADITSYSEMLKVAGAALIGGIAFKVMEKFLNGKDFADEHTILRQELRAELDSVRKDVTELEAEVSKWRDLYYEQKSINASLQAEVIALRHELNEYKTQINHLDLLPPNDSSH